MRIAPSVLLLPLLCIVPAAFARQSSAAAASAPAAAAPLPSAILQSSLDGLTQAISAVKLEKWKGGSIRGETAPYLDSIQKDLQSTLPSLLKDADAAPASMTRLLPVLRNIDALYDVVLRVADSARMAAPTDQANQLQEALVNLDKGRRAIHDRLMSLASGQEKQVSDLQLAIKNQPPPPVCPVVPAPEPKPVAKKKVVKKKPATPAAKPATVQPNGAAKPNP